MLPDWQGLGIGPMFDDWLGAYLFERGERYHNTTANPTMIRAYSRSPRWKLLRKGEGTLRSSKRAQRSLAKQQGKRRRMSTATFAYVHPKEG